MTGERRRVDSCVLVHLFDEAFPANPVLPILSWARQFIADRVDDPVRLYRGGPLSGSAVFSGADYQASVIAYIYVHILTGTKPT